MPIPKPKKGEKEKDFISRCMGAIGDEYDDNKQAVAICYQSWKDKDKPSGNEMTPLVANLDLTEVKTRTWKGRKHYVAPVVMAVPGVMNELLYPADELAKYVSAWDGRPVTLFHPKSEDGEFISANSDQVPESVHLGMVRNATYDEEKLRGETWLDIDHTRSVRPEVLEYYEGGKDKLEVSTGLWGDVVRVSGEYEGTKYTGIMTNIRPDHLALLPGGEGACNWTDGCGLRANESSDWEGQLAAKLLDRFYGNITDRELREALQKALGELDTSTKIHYLEEVDLTKKEIIYEEYTRSTGVGELVPVSTDCKLYRRGYTMENGAATLADNPTEVQKVTSYKVVTSEKKGCCKMTKDEKIQALIKDPRTKFEEGCKDFLSGLNEDQLDRLTPPENVIVKPVEEPKANVQQEPVQTNQQNENPAPKNAEEWLATQEQMPKEVRDSILEGIALNAMQRAEMIELITKDPRSTFTNEQLTAKPTSELKALSALVKPLEQAPEVNQGQFFGMRIGGQQAPANNEAPAGPDPLVMPDLTETFKANLKK